MRTFFLLMLLIVTWALNVYHLGTAPPPKETFKVSHPKSKWFPKEKFGIHQLVLEGTPYERGLAAGQFTHQLLWLQEKSLQDELKHVIPSTFLQRLLYFGMMRWFWGLGDFLDPEMREEMWGVSQSVSHDFDFLADPYTRQIAYHGLHEVGQTMVDMHPEFGGPETMGCTVLAYPTPHGWKVGRTFDFEGGEVFDSHKIMKWVFPDTGYPYVSVIWAGMVGAVTGVNAQGVYISINAAGTKDFRRLGTPSTLVLTKALQYSKTAEEARRIIEESSVFITDIYVVSQSQRNILYRIEKSPKRFQAREETKPLAISNHLVSDLFRDDAINILRREKMTSLARYERGQELIERFSPPSMETLLFLLRDKKQKGGIPLPMGNRLAIDALIASHAVLFDGAENTLYVSQGPALIGPFLGFDLKKSFEARMPILLNSLPSDPEVSLELYRKIIQERRKLREAKASFKKKDWTATKKALEEAIAFYGEDSEAYKLQGDYEKVFGEKEKARRSYARALELRIPYLNERIQLEKKIQP